MWLNWGCGPFPAPKPWHNIDVVRQDDTQPDQVVDAVLPLPFPAGSCERIYLGHMLEHWPWTGVKALLTEVGRLLPPDGEVLVVGPDVYRAIKMWKAGHPQGDWELIVASLEGMSSYDAETTWDQARHHWNCTEERLVGALDNAGFEPEALPVTPEALDGWPLVSFMQHQCAVRATLRK